MAPPSFLQSTSREPTHGHALLHASHLLSCQFLSSLPLSSLKLSPCCSLPVASSKYSSLLFSSAGRSSKVQSGLARFPGSAVSLPGRQGPAPSPWPSRPFSSLCSPHPHLIASPLLRVPSSWNLPCPRDKGAMNIGLSNSFSFSFVLNVATTNCNMCSRCISAEQCSSRFSSAPSAPLAQANCQLNCI